jgi:hypothetical protein
VLLHKKRAHPASQRRQKRPICSFRRAWPRVPRACAEAWRAGNHTAGPCAWNQTGPAIQCTPSFSVQKNSPRNRNFFKCCIQAYCARICLIIYPLFGWAYQHGLSAVEQCFFLTANQPQPAYKPKNNLPNRAIIDCFLLPWWHHTTQILTCQALTKQEM